MSDELPRGWARATLGGLFDFKYGKGLLRENRNGKGSVKVYGSNGVVGVHDKAVTKGPTIIVGRKGSVGEVHFSLDPCWPIDTAYFIDEFPFESPPVYWALYLKSLRLGQQEKSSAIPGISREDIYDSEVPVPPLTEQRRIVAKLETLLGKVDASQQRLAKIPVLLKRFRQSVLAAACSGRLTADWREENPNTENAATRWNIKDAPVEDDDLPGLPATWVFRRLDDISERVSVTHVGPTSQYYCEKSEGVLFLRSQNVRPAKLDLTGSLYISRSFHEANKKSHLKPGDLLIVRVGANRGDTCVLPVGLGEVNCANVIFARPFQGISEYLNIYFQTPFCQKNLQVLTTGSAQGVVNTKVVAGVPIAVPPLPEQQEIVRRVEGLFALSDQLELRLAKARGEVDQLTPSLLARAFAGQLVPQDPNDEPASVLLERIKTHYPSKSRRDDRQ